MDVHVRELRSFLAVAEHLHFGRAAESLFLSQPALSKQIRSLETHVRIRLFTRDRRGVELTEAGEAFLPEVRRVLDAWERAEHALARTAPTLHVGISTGLGRGLLPAIRARFEESRPEARLHVRQVRWDDPTGGLAGRGPDRTDAAFVWLPLPRPERYAHLPVATEPLRVLLPSGHRLAAMPIVPVDALLDEPFLALPRRAAPSRDVWLARAYRKGVDPRIGAEVASTDETIEALAAGLGVCLIAAGNAPLFDRPEIAIRDVAGCEPVTLALAWRNDEEPRDALVAFIAATRAVAAR